MSVVFTTQRTLAHWQESNKLCCLYRCLTKRTVDIEIIPKLAVEVCVNILLQWSVRVAGPKLQESIFVEFWDSINHRIYFCNHISAVEQTLEARPLTPVGSVQTIWTLLQQMTSSLVKKSLSIIFTTSRKLCQLFEETATCFYKKKFPKISARLSSERSI